MRFGRRGLRTAGTVVGVALVTGGLLAAPSGAHAALDAAFVGLRPCRLVDTRGNGFGGAFGPPALAAAAPRSLPLFGQCGIPTSAVAVSLNVTATDTLGPGFLLLFPEGATLPLASTLNYLAGETVANAAIVPLGTGGGLTVVAGVSGTDLVLDVDGYFEDTLVHDVGVDNTFVGLDAGNFATTGQGNTAVGARALDANITGNFNTATGQDALASNTTGSFNTAIGSSALRFSTSSANTAIGSSALRSNMTGSQNTATGEGALSNNVTGSDNTATGASALRLSTTTANTAIGALALSNNTSGDSNTATGRSALANNSTGSGNIALGVNAGSNLTTGNNNIHIGHVGVAAEAATLRLGTAQTRAFVAGIAGRTVDAATDAPVLVDGNNKLGTVASSRQVKQDITDMGAASRGLLRLRPVTFRYRPETGRGSSLQYGLIAEEVAEVYPELVVRDATGAPETVRYHLLPALLLNELQRQARVVAEKDRQLQELAGVVAELAARLARLEGRAPVAASRRPADP